MPLRLKSAFEIFESGLQILNSTPVVVSKVVKKKNGNKEGKTTIAKSKSPWWQLSIYFLGNAIKIVIKNNSNSVIEPFFK